MCIETVMKDVDQKWNVKPIGVGAQSTLGGGHKIFAGIICIKNQQMPEFYMILARKIIKIPEFLYLPGNLQNSRILHDVCPKIPEFYIIIARKIFFPNFRGHMPPLPRLLRLWLSPIQSAVCTGHYEPERSRRR